MTEDRRLFDSEYQFTLSSDNSAEITFIFGPFCSYLFLIQPNISVKNWNKVGIKSMNTSVRMFTVSALSYTKSSISLSSPRDKLSIDLKKSGSERATVASIRILLFYIQKGLKLVLSLIKIMIPMTAYTSERTR